MILGICYSLFCSLKAKDLNNTTQFSTATRENIFKYQEFCQHE